MSGVLFSPLNNGDLQGRNAEIVKASHELGGSKRITDLTPVAPMAVERVITAQMNYYANNDQNVRSRTLFHATPIGIGWALTLIARVLRAVIRTLGMLISVPVAAFQQSRYGQMTNNSDERILDHNLILEDLRRVGQEWVDLGITFLCLPIGMVNTFAPGAISTQFLYDYYVERTMLNADRNQLFSQAKEAYTTQQEVKHQAWQAGMRAAQAELRQ